MKILEHLAHKGHLFVVAGNSLGRHGDCARRLRLQVSLMKNDGSIFVYCHRKLAGDRARGRSPFSGQFLQKGIGGDTLNFQIDVERPMFPER